MTAEPSPRPDAGFSPPHPLALRSLFPQLEILGLLGHGGMGAVYKARQRGLDRMVALKILPPQISTEPAFAERFAREARALARLSHPNVVTVIDLGKSGSLYYFLMEFVDGVNLRQMLQAGRLAPRDALGLILQICEALEYAHGEGVVHRDIKPENILVDTKGHVKIADFGLSKLLGAAQPDVQLTLSNQVLGTMHYMAPEQIDKPLEVDHRADLYSLGVVFYEMLTGELPLGRFELPSRKSAVDSRVDELVLRMLERNPGSRYQHASEIRLQLESVAGVASKLSPEVTRKLSYEYRTKTALFGWPLLHVAIGVDPATGLKRNAKGIIALGCRPIGVIAFGDVAVGVIACGIFGYGLVSISVVAVGVVALGSVAAGLWLAMGGVALAPIAIGGAAFGYYANGAMVFGKHAIGPGVYDLQADQFFNPWSGRFMRWIFIGSIVCIPVFLTLGFIPSLMAKMSERRRKSRFEPDQSKSVQNRFNPAGHVWKIFLCALSLVAGSMAGGMFSTALGLVPPQFPETVDMRWFGVYAFTAGVVLAIALAALLRRLQGSRWTRFVIIGWFVYAWMGINNAIEAHIYTSVGGGRMTVVTMLFACLFVAGAGVLLFTGQGGQSFSKNLRQFFANRTPTQWTLRLAAAVLAFPLVYFVFGMPVGLIVSDSYRNHAFGLRLPSSLNVILGVQFIRSAFALLAALPILVAWRGSRRRFGWTFGLSLFVVSGLYGLIQAFWMPWTMRSVHAVELLLDSLAYGWLLALLLLPRTPMRNPVPVEQAGIRSYNI
ncbi:MAG TPA: serine/threonine-protein kinase [Candidatus Limnocylindrales bacterium]|nr:serine/threonine-protein kinase [Candidatus Limnocylindrales bacterium]